MTSEVEEIPAELDEKRLPFTEHLRELRSRTIRAVVYLVVGFVVAWNFHSELFEWLAEPFRVAMNTLEGTEHAPAISFRGPIEPIVVYLKTSLLIGALAVIPLVLLEAWLFVAPGLYKDERRLALPFLLASMVFFLGGTAFCRYLVLDPTMTVLLKFGEANQAVVMMQEYFSFASRLLFVFGALFELPVVVSFLAMIGVLTHRSLIKYWRYSVVLAFVIGAMFTPPDPLTQIMLAVPMVALYGLSIVLAYVISRGRAMPTAETDEEES